MKNTILKLLDLVQTGQLSGDRINMIRSRIHAISADGSDPTDAELAPLFDTYNQSAGRIFEPLDYTGNGPASGG